MTQLGKIAKKIRSKNAGPFWLTVDIFCADAAGFERVRAGLSDQSLAQILGISPQELKRFEIADLMTVKLSFPRPTVQGAPADRDMHGASFEALIGTIELTM